MTKLSMRKIKYQHIRQWELWVREFFTEPVQSISFLSLRYSLENILVKNQSLFINDGLLNNSE